MSELSCTPSQTVGPFFGMGLPYPRDSELVGDELPGLIRLRGTVYEGAGAGVPDALIELWQPDGAGRIARAAGSRRRDGQTFTGWGRAATGVDGHYGFTTLAPGSASAERPPFFDITVFAQGPNETVFLAYGDDLR